MTDYTMFGGKGGVGKTTCAAGYAVALAAGSHETLVVSTDPAHSLGDALDADVGAEPTPVTGYLEAVEIDPASRADRYRALAEALAEDMRSVGVRVPGEDLDALFGGAMPGADEIAALDLFAEYLEGYDRVVFDTAPTGHTLRLLDLPDTVGRAVETAASVRSQVRRTADTARSMVFGPAAFRGEDGADEGFEDLTERMERVEAALRDPDRTGFRVVFRPEALVLAETERLVDRLREYGVPITDLVANGVLTDVNEDCTRCTRQRDRQRERLEEVSGRFDLPVTEVPELDEPRGVEALRAVGEALDGA
ncbi:MAG: ArsA family ATPase [Haloarculaceae archaeon]